MSAGNAGAAIGLANTNKVGPIGAYVQDALHPTAENDYAGINADVSYVTNVLGEAIGFTAYGTQGAVRGKTAQWVQNGATALVPTDKVTIAAGVATKDNSTGTHTVFATVPANAFFWAFEN